MKQVRLSKRLTALCTTILLLPVWAAGCDNNANNSSMESEFSQAYVSEVSSMPESPAPDDTSSLPSSDVSTSTSAGLDGVISFPDTLAASADDVIPTGAGTGLGYKGSDWRVRIANIELLMEDSEIPHVSQITKNTDGRTHYLDSRIMDDFNAMMDASVAAGVNLTVISAYRTYSYQENLFEKRVTAVIAEQGLSRALAENEVAQGTARPGTSDHNLGLAVDFNSIYESFENTKEFNWLISHCAEYGFILRYPEDKVDTTKVMYEPWHYRYVGKEYAQEIMARGICLEEFVLEQVQ